MRARIKAGIIAVGAATVFASGTALAAPAADGVFFIHGTGDFSAPSTQANPTDGSAISSYWTLSSIQTMIRDPAGGNWTYGVAGYPGGTYNALSTAYNVATQIEQFYRANGPVLNIVLITHSNGSNPVRYMMAHPTYLNQQGHSYGTVLSWVRKVVFVAGDNAGTPLADKVTQSGSFANIANDIVSIFGSSYNNASVLAQVQATMATYNSNGTFATGSTPGGITTNYVYGTNVYANIFSGDAWCGGYATTVGLKAAQVYGWGSSSAATDGFIGTNSSTYVGTAGMSGDSRLNHNQSRRSCHGSGGTIASLAHGALSGAFDAIPPDYTISPASQACNSTLAYWRSASPYAGNFYQYGCTSAMQTDANTDFDCQTAYGGDNGYPLSAAEYPTTMSAYFNNTYYAGGAGCSDTWRGDGECDLCLVAKYGYDSVSGSIADDDCVNQGAGTQSKCADLAYYDQTSAVGYYSYTANH